MWSVYLTDWGRFQLARSSLQVDHRTIICELNNSPGTSLCKAWPLPFKRHLYISSTQKDTDIQADRQMGLRRLQCVATSRLGFLIMQRSTKINENDSLNCAEFHTSFHFFHIYFAVRVRKWMAASKLKSSYTSARCQRFRRIEYTIVEVGTDEHVEQCPHKNLHIGLCRKLETVKALILGSKLRRSLIRNFLESHNLI